MFSMKYLVFATAALFHLVAVSAVTAGGEAGGTSATCGPGEYTSTVCNQCEVNTYKRSTARPKRPCVDCKEGFGTLSRGSLKCIKFCKLGKRYNTTTSSCEKCQLGSYMDVRSLNTECMPCLERMTTVREGTDSSDKCICFPGYQPNSDNSDCELCPDGTFKSRAGNMNCTICPGSTKTSTLKDGAVSRANCTRVCGPGKELNVTSDSCDQCEKNFYKASTGIRERCKPCEPNTVANRKGMDSCEGLSII